MSNEPNPQLAGRPYANYFSVLRELTNTGDNILKFCRNNLLNLLDEKRGKPLNILSVGYGTGIIETEVLTHLKPHFARIRFDGVEPNEVHEKQFHVRLDAPHPLHFSLMECVRSKGFDLSTKTVSLEQFEPEDGVSYDLILLSHVLYYPADRAAAIRRTLSFLSPSGIIIIFQQTPAGLNEIQRLFAAEMSMPPHYYSSLEAQSVLQAEGVDYQTTLFDQTLDVTDALRGDNLQDIPHRGMALISFLCERDLGGLRETAPSSINWPALQKLREFIRRTSFPLPGDRWVIFYPTAAIVAKRRFFATQPPASFVALSIAALPARNRPWSEFRDLNLETIVLRSALLPDMLRLRAEKHGSRTIIEYGHSDNGGPIAVTAAKFYRAVQFLAFGLHQAGVKPKDRIAFLSSPSPSSLVLVAALWHLGAVVVPLALALPVKALQEQLSICRASLLLVSDAWATTHPDAVQALQIASGNRWRMGLFDQSAPAPKPQWAELAPLRSAAFDIDLPREVALADCALHPDDLAAILFSSGTTGSPKAVPLTHLNILFSAHTRNALWPSLVNEETRVLGWMPLCHVMGLVVEWATTSLYSGGAYLMPSAAVASMPTPSGLLSLAAAAKATTLSCVPWMLGQWRQLATSDETSLTALRSLRYILYGGAPMERSDVEWYRQQGVRLQQGMGMTEVGTLFVAPEDTSALIDELSPLPGFHYRLRRPTGRNNSRANEIVDTQGDTETGEMLVKSLSVSKGYLNRPEGDGFSSDGYYCTGDLFVRLPNGRYRFECRLDDLLVLSTGEKLNPVLIETQIRELAAPNVALVCLISGPVLPIAVIEPNWSVAADNVTLQHMQTQIWDVVARVNETLPSWARLQRQNVWVLDRHEAPLPTTRKHVVDRPLVRKRFEGALEATSHHKSAKPSDSMSVNDKPAPTTNEQTGLAMEISTFVEDILAIRLRPGDVDRSLIELGLSSFFAIQLAVAMKQRWSQLTTNAVLASPTITDLVRLVQVAESEPNALLGAEALVTPMRTMNESLLYWFTRKPLARLRLLLVNDMGGTATDFAQFDRLSPQEIEVVALNLPGHRGRPKSTYLKDIPALTETFINEAVPQLSDRPLAIYGQCMGGHVAYEIALQIQKRSSLRLKAVAVGGCPAPSSAGAFKRTVAGDEPTDEEIREMLDGPATAGSGGSREKHAMLLAALYEWYSKDMIADHAMFTSTLKRYMDPTAPAPEKLTVPLIACFGRKDDTINADEVTSWHHIAAADFEFKVLNEGSHILFAEAPFIRWLTGRLLSV